MGLPEPSHVVVGTEEAGMLGGLAADEGGAGLAAAPRDTGNDLRDATRHHPAAGDVVGHEQGCRTDDDDVVDDHPDQVDADAVVLVDGLGDRHLRADTVGGGREQRTGEGGEERHVEESGEAADSAEHPGSVGGRDRRRHEFDGTVTCRGVDAGFGVLVGHWNVRS